MRAARLPNFQSTIDWHILHLLGSHAMPKAGRWAERAEPDEKGRAERFAADLVKAAPGTGGAHTEKNNGVSPPWGAKQWGAKQWGAKEVGAIGAGYL